MEKSSTLINMKQSMSALLEVLDEISTRSLEQEKEIEELHESQEQLIKKLEAFDNILTDMLDDYESEHGKDDKHKMWVKQYEEGCRLPF